MNPTDLPAIGVMLPRDLPADQVLDYARRADELGFAELWVVEDLGFRGGIAQAAACLAVTATIRVGVGILPAAARNAAFEAMEWATLAQLFPGRIIAGIGHGMPAWMRQVDAWPARPLRYLGTHAQTVRALLAGQAAAGFEGVRLDGLRLEDAVVPEVVPEVLLGVRGPKSLETSGRVADGTILAEPVTPEYVRAAREHIAERAHRIVAYNVAAVDDDAGQAIATARPALTAIGEPDWAPHIAPLPFADAFAALRAECASGQEFAERLPADWVAALALAGTPEQVRARIAELAAAGVTSSVFIPAGEPRAALESLSRVL